MSEWFCKCAITSGDPLRIIGKTTTSLPQTYNRQKRLKPDTVITFRCLFPKNCRIILPLKKISDPGNYDTLVFYRMEDTLITYRQFTDQWSILTYNTNYDFRRISKLCRKKSWPPLVPFLWIRIRDLTFTVEINVLALKHSREAKTFSLRKEGNLLLFIRSGKPNQLPCFYNWVRYEKIILINILFLSFWPVFLSAYAVKAYPHPIQVTQPDGSVLTIRKHGDEFLNAGPPAGGFPGKTAPTGFITLPSFPLRAVRATPRGCNPDCSLQDLQPSDHRLWHANAHSV